MTDQNPNYDICADLRLIKNLLNLTWRDLARKLEIKEITLNRWANNKSVIRNEYIEKIYDIAYSKGININKIYSLFYKEKYNKTRNMILFHGSNICTFNKETLDKFNDSHDFGKGFYCGDSLEQSSMLVSSYESSSIYIIKFKNNDLRSYKFNVDRDWLFAVAYYRGTLGHLKNHPLVKNVIKKLENIDYIIAPIADNKMYLLMDEFISGALTDVQCMHCLSATDLGYQYVFKSEKSLKQIEILRKGYLTKSEKLDYLKQRLKDNNDAENKVMAAKIKYRGQGLYIDELLK